MPMQTVTTLAQLDEKLDIAAGAAKRSGKDFRKALDSFVLDPRALIGTLPKDPRSEGYKAAQMRLYELIAGSSYTTENEKTPFDHEHMMRWPFPYSTRSASMVGDYLMTYGNLIKTMNLAPGARILEVGSGYGPLTYQLASMGHHVTCVDVHAPLLAYVRERTRNLPGKVETLIADMNDLRVKDSFDAIVFFESFHHGADHAGLLRRLPHMLEPNGILVLAGEPIVPKGAVAVPYPWGLRMDGLSLWFIRRHGWLELGFEEPYLRSLIEELGWTVACKSNHSVPTMGVWLAKRSAGSSAFASPYEHGEIASWSAGDSKLKTQVAVLAKDGNSLFSSGKEGYLVYGPYASLDTGFYEVQWEGRLDSPVGTGHVDVAHDGGMTVLRQTEFTLTSRTTDTDSRILLHMRFSINESVHDLEFRLHVDSGVYLHIDRVVLRKF